MIWPDERGIARCLRLFGLLEWIPVALKSALGPQ